jgi:diacylglycerol kinase (ATP)
MSVSEPSPPRWVAIQRNPRSGSGRQRMLLVDLVRALRRRGLRPCVFKDRQRLADRIADPKQRDGLVGIVAAGGDGTVADVFNRYPGIPVAILPMGTENLLARYLKIRASGEEIARLIASGSLRRFDLGLLGERRFALMASAGLDAEIIHRVHAARRGHISHASYLQPILDSFRKYEYPRYELSWMTRRSLFRHDWRW